MVHGQLWLWIDGSRRWRVKLGGLRSWSCWWRVLWRWFADLQSSIKRCGSSEISFDGTVWEATSSQVFHLCPELWGRRCEDTWRNGLADGDDEGAFQVRHEWMWMGCFMFFWWGGYPEKRQVNLVCLWVGWWYGWWCRRCKVLYGVWYAILVCGSGVVGFLLAGICSSYWGLTGLYIVYCGSKYGIDDNTIDFIGHSLALHRDDRFLSEPALDTVKSVKVHTELLLNKVC